MSICQEKTIDTNLEKRNFKTTGEILAKIWEETVVADYFENATKDPVDLNEKWISVHCRISQYLLNCGFSQMPHDLYYPSLIKAKVKNWVCKQFGIYYLSTAARKRHRQDGYDLQVLGNKVTNEEEDMTHEENSEILAADGDDNHVPVINIYELLINSELKELETDRDS